MPDLLSDILMVLLFTAIGGMFAASEIALVTLRETQIESMAARSKAGRKVKELTKDSNRFLSAVQIGVTLAGFFSASFGASQISPYLEPVLEGLGMSPGAAGATSFIGITLAISYLSIVFGERTVAEIMTPRTEIEFLDAGTPIAEAQRLVTELGFSRYPIRGETEDDVLGFIHIRDLINPPAEQRAKPANRDSRATESSRASLPFGVGDLPSPMLAKAGKPADVTLGQAAGEKWAFEMKWDGYRVIAGVRAAGESGGGVVLASRNGKDLTELFTDAAELAELLQGEAAELGGAVLDGELIALDDSGRPDFGLLQSAVNDDVDAELRYMVFDVLSLGSPDKPDNSRQSLLRTPYSERRKILEEILSHGDAVVVPPTYNGKLAQAERVSKELGLEGVVAKRRDSIYLPGQRGSAWIKLKFQAHQDFVVVGVRSEDGTSAGRLKSVLVAIPDDDGQLSYAGRVGSGFSQKQIAEIGARLKMLERKTPAVDDVPESDQRDAW